MRFGPLSLRCDVCALARPHLAGLQEVDYRSKTFSCSQCGSEAYLAVIEPIKEAAMQDYRLDPIERAERHPAATDRLMGCSRQSSASYSRGELPGRKIDGRR